MAPVGAGSISSRNGGASALRSMPPLEVGGNDAYTGGAESGDIPPHIDAAARKFARQEYPRDYSMQEYVYNEQIECWVEVEALSRQLASHVAGRQILEHAEHEYPTDWSMRAHTVKEEIAAYQSLASLHQRYGADGQFLQILDDARREWPTDFGMQLHEVQEQMGALRRMGRKRR